MTPVDDARKVQLEAEFTSIDIARALRDRGLDAVVCIVGERWVVAVETPARPEPVHLHDEQDADFLLRELGHGATT